jgi:hypothetical protein
LPDNYVFQVFLVLALNFPIPAFTLQLNALTVVVFVPEMPERSQNFLQLPPNSQVQCIDWLAIELFLEDFLNGR